MKGAGRLIVIAGIALAFCGVAYLVAADALGLFDDPDDGVLYAVGDDGELIELDTSPTLVSKGKGLSPEEEDALARERAAEAAKPQFEKGEGLYGVVRDGAGNAIKNARVMVMRAPVRQYQQWVPLPAPIATTLTDENGEFLVGPAPEEEPLILRAEAGGYAPTNEYVARRGTRVDLILDQGGGLKIRVLDIEGEPVAGASVMHSIGWGWNAILSSGSTAEDGTVTFQAVPTGSGNVVVTAKGHAAVRQNNVAVIPKEVEERTIVLEASKLIEGTVLDAATSMPIEGAAIEIHYPNLKVLDPTRGTTDEDGKFSILADVTTGERIEIRARADEYTEQRVTRNIQDQADELTIKLGEGFAPIPGYVNGPDRRGIAGATVTYMGFQDEKDLPSVKTDEDGSFELPALPWGSNGANVLAISKEHGASTTYVRFVKKDGAPPTPIEINLPGAGIIEGTVTGRDGNPVEGAIVSLAVDYKETRSRLGPSVNPWQVGNLLNDRRRFNLTAISDSVGRFKIEGVPALAYRVLAKFGLDQARTEEPVTVEAGAVTHAEITLKTGGTITGVVLDSEEEPVPGAYLYAQPQDQRAQGWGLPQPYARTQSDGSFVLRGVEDYDYTVYANAGGYGSVNERNIRQGETELTLRVVRLGWIQGTVEALDGSPYSGTFMVHATKKRSANERRRWWGNNSQAFNTDDGKFELRGINEGEYHIRASTRSGAISMQQELVRVSNGFGSRDVALRLTEGAVLRGKVTNEEDGKPINRAWVYISVRNQDGKDQSGAQSGNARSDSKGRYEIKGLGSGSYNVNVWYEGLNWSTPVDVQLGETKELDLVKRAPGMIEITVLDTEGKPVANVWPNVKSEAGQHIQPNWNLMRKDGLMGSGNNAWNEATRTNGEGIVVRYHIPPGRYQITAAVQGYQAEGEAPWVDVDGGSTTPITVKVKKTQ